MSRELYLFLLLIPKLAILFDPSRNDLTTKIHAALEKVLDYIYHNRQFMNVDGLFGVVLAKANLEELIRYGDKSNEGRFLLESQMEKVSKILNEVDFEQMKLNGDYKLFATYLLNPEAWKKNISFTFGNVEPIQPDLMKTLPITCNSYMHILNKTEFDEEISDDCLVELIKASRTNPSSCPVSNFCNQNLLNNDLYAIGFGILHRLLFLEVTEALGCKWNENWTKQRIEEFCSHILWETLQISKCEFDPELDDLFLEQILLCGFEGYEEFLSTKWIQHVLEIQKPPGCFGTTQNRHDEFKRKRKREANELEFGCIDHTTGLGTATLSLFLRFLNYATIY